MPAISPTWLAPALSLPSMPLSMAESAQCGDVCHCIGTESAPSLQMMNLQVVEGTALLTAPTVSFQHLIA